MKRVYTITYMLFIGFILAMLTTDVCSQNTSFLVLNEIEVNNPGGDNQECEYIEIRGDAGTTVPSNTYLVQLEGDGTGAGTADTVFDLSGQNFGLNGLIVVKGVFMLALADKVSQSKIKKSILGSSCGSRNYSIEGATVNDNNGMILENGAVSFLLINSPTTAIMQNTDYDTNNDGTLNNLPGDATIIDAVGWQDGTLPNLVYGGVDITPSTGTPHAATRDFNNVTPRASAAWFADELTSSNIDSRLYNQTNFVGGYRIDFITPGLQNLAPNSANGTILGRARNAKGLGIKHAVIMLTGGNLQQPLYATTNQFGNYRFEDIPLGQSYLLQISSGKHTFENSSRIINLSESIDDADFIVASSGTTNTQRKDGQILRRKPKK